MGQRCWRDLDLAQADGWACVVCARDFLRFPTSRVPVGHSVTGLSVMACGGFCAERAVSAGWWLRVPSQAWTVAGVAFLAAMEKVTTGDLREVYPGELITPTVQAAAPLIVAAELRRLVTRHRPRTGAPVTYGDRWYQEGIERVCAALTRRADELDPAEAAR